MSWIDVASEHLNVKLKPHVEGQAVGPCPFCQKGEDRFVVFAEGNFWCRACGGKGWWRKDKPTAEEIAAIKAEKAKAQARLYSQMSRCTDWMRYHDQVEEGFGEWLKHGITIDAIMRWGLGYCKSAPLSPQTPSLTIPVFHQGKLMDIRHRLIGGEDGNKYRSHMPGLTPPFFNLDALISGKKLYVVEGEKKAIILMAYGIEPVLSYPGIGFAGSIVSSIQNSIPPGAQRDIVFIPDPGTQDKIEAVAWDLDEVGHKCYVLDLFDKPDDFIREYGINNMHGALRMVRKIGRVTSRRK